MGDSPYKLTWRVQAGPARPTFWCTIKPKIVIPMHLEHIKEQKKFKHRHFPFVWPIPPVNILGTCPPIPVYHFLGRWSARMLVRPIPFYKLTSWNHRIYVILDQIGLLFWGLREPQRGSSDLRLDWRSAPGDRKLPTPKVRSLHELAPMVIGFGWYSVGLFSFLIWFTVPRRFIVHSVGIFYFC